MGRSRLALLRSPALLVIAALAPPGVAEAVLPGPLGGSGHGSRAPSRSAGAVAAARAPAAGADGSSPALASSAPADPAYVGRRSRALAAALVAAVLLWARPRPAFAKRIPKPVIAQNQDFEEVQVSKWVQTAKGQPDLVLGLKGDPYWLLPGKEGGALRNFALRAECTHLGCIAPWDARARKFVCPCHGSQYDEEGNVLRGPAPHGLALAHVELTKDEKVQLSYWTEEDFRDGSPPWWA